MNSPVLRSIASSIMAIVVVLATTVAAQTGTSRSQPPYSSEKGPGAVGDCATMSGGIAAPQRTRLKSTLEGEPTMAAVPLEQLVRPDGTLDLASGFQGGVSMAGWRMVSGPGEAPRFERGGDGDPDRAGQLMTPSTSTFVPEDAAWDDRFGETRIDYAVWALATDGNGNLYVGGDFTTVADGVSASHIARWDGAKWWSLDGGANGSVFALAVDGSGNLYAGGDFTVVGMDRCEFDGCGVSAPRIAKWDGSRWWSLDAGVGARMNGRVRALAVDRDANLYAGGDFTTPALHVARWRGSNWLPLGAGVDGSVRALVVDRSGNLYAGGDFTAPASHMAKWDGSSWLPLGEGMNGNVWALAVDGSGNVYAGGGFFRAGGEPAEHIAVWSGGRWLPLHSGTDGAVKGLAVDGNGILYACGDFTTAGGMRALRVALWNGATWSPLESGIGDNFVAALAVDSNGDLYAGGLFLDAANSIARRIARWDGARWSALGEGTGVVHALAVDGRDGGGNLYAAGYFSSAGGVIAYRVARWDGTGWWPLGEGMPPEQGLDTMVRALAVDGSGDTYAGGNFTVPWSNIARWHASRWWPLGEGMNGDVLALAVDGRGNLYAGGEFTSPAWHVARWDGSRWWPLGEGMTGSVQALAVDASGNLYAGGSFYGAGGVPANHIARWDGTRWWPLGEGMNGDVVTLAVGGSGSLYAGGRFTTADGVPANHIAKWDGTRWWPLGEGMNGTVYALAMNVSVSGNLYAGGYFLEADGAPASNIAMWDGRRWSPLGSGTNGAVLALAETGGGNLYAGGNFTTAGGNASHGLGIWHTAAIGASAGPGGSISPSGTVIVPRGSDQSFTITPDAGYHVADVWVDGTSVGAATSYVFTDVRSNHSIASSFTMFVDATSAPLDDDGNGRGAAWGDFDNDGYLDLYVSKSGQANKLFRNDGGGAFVDATSDPLGDTGHGNGVAWADYDNDGDLDLFLVNFGPTQANKLFRNEGNGQFVDVAAGTPLADGTGFGMGVAWGDYDNDGYLDLYITKLGHANKLFRNDGGGAFVDATSAPLDDGGIGTGVAWGDFDNDGDLDLYVANYGQANKLFRNDGGGAFVDATSAPLDDGGKGVGVAWGDFDNDGDLDLFLANEDGPNRLFRNDRGGTFVDVASGTPLAHTGSAAGVAWGDYDNDGDLDLCITNGIHPLRLFRNDGGSWVDATSGPLSGVLNGIGAAWGDYDNDGDVDLYVSVWGGTRKLFRNENTSGNHWLQVKLLGTVSNRSAIGARVRIVPCLVDCGTDESRVAEISGGSGYLSQNAMVASFGLGTATAVDLVEVRWPSGIVQVVRPVPIDRQILVIEPGPDLDGDGIANEIDLEPTRFSDWFSDVSQGGDTEGQIVWRGDQVVTVTDAAAPDQGVQLSCDGAPGSRPAAYSICGSRASVELGAGMTTILTCRAGSGTAPAAIAPVVVTSGQGGATSTSVAATSSTAGLGGLTMSVGVGPVATYLGREVSASVPSGAILQTSELGGGQSSISNLSEGPTTIEVSVAGVVNPLAPGGSLIVALPEGPPVCEVTPDIVEFGRIAPGDVTTGAVVIRNVGAGVLTGLVSGVCPGFELVSPATIYHLGAGESHTAQVRFRPLAEGEFSCMLATGADGCGPAVLHGTADNSAVVAMGFDLTPHTLNLTSNGLWVTGILEPPPPFAASQIDPASIRLNGTVSVDTRAPNALGDHDGDGIPDLMVKLNRAAMELTVVEGDQVPVTVSGKVDGRSFVGTDSIRVRRAVVSAPAAGSHLTGGEVTTVRWETPSGVTAETVALLQSLDGGSTWSLIAHGQPNTGSCAWTVPNAVASQARVALVLVESADSSGCVVDGVLGVSEAFTIDGALGVGDGALVPLPLAIRGARPNPAAGGRLWVEFTLRDGSAANLSLMDVAGRVLDTWDVGSLGAGPHKLDLSERGVLRSGIYFLNLRQGGEEARARVTVVK